MIRIGDRVQTRNYGPGIVMDIHFVARGSDTYFVKVDDPRVAKFGWLKQDAESLTIANGK